MSQRNREKNRDSTDVEKTVYCLIFKKVFISHVFRLFWIEILDKIQISKIWYLFHGFFLSLENMLSHWFENGCWLLVVGFKTQNTKTRSLLISNLDIDNYCSFFWSYVSQFWIMVMFVITLVSETGWLP